jgi:GT2 family glycosyltransferase
VVPLMRASIIIPTHNRHAMLVALLGSLVDAGAGEEDLEVIVVDDGSTDDIEAAVAIHKLPVVLLQTGEKSGPSKARNLGATAAQGDLLLFLDADGVVEADWLEVMLEAGGEGRILLGNVVDFEGARVQSVPRRATFLGKSLSCKPEDANTGPSCNLGIPKAHFDMLGGFDEELPYYFEDSDLCIRAAQAGVEFSFVPDAVFRHHGTEHKTELAIRWQEQNSSYAMLKYYEGDWLRSFAFVVLNGAWMAARASLWLLSGRGSDSVFLLQGWAGAHARFVRARL